MRHGAWSDHVERDDVERHRQVVAGTWPLLGDHAVLSHGSAAVLHGLPVWPSLLERVSLTRPDGGHGTRTRQLHVRLAPLLPAEVVELDGYRVTCLERTAVDVARMLDFERAVAVLDAALHAGADPALVRDIALAAANRRGARVARRALDFADRRSESVGESISRVRMAQVGLPVPVLQLEVVDAGVWIARVDFAWPEWGVVGEFDGKVKYSGGAEAAAAAIMLEKRRQQAIEDAGWIVVRWTWSDLQDLRTFRAHISSALARGARLRSADSPSH